MRYIILIYGFGNEGLQSELSTLYSNQNNGTETVDVIGVQTPRKMKRFTDDELQLQVTR